jgi:DNA cross-link repair 1B protein
MLKNVISLDYNKEYEIFLSKTKTIKYMVTLFDANHIAGSAMMLFKGPLGTFFHTGDSRFDDYMFDDYKVLFPNHLGKRDFVPIEDSGANTLIKKTNDTVVCHVPESIHIDELILDNTYCDPIFKFPKREFCVQGIFNIISINQPCDVYISTYNLGKEEILVQLAKVFKTKIVVDQERYKDVISLGFDEKYFTTKIDQGWIYCMKWKDKTNHIKL